SSWSFASASILACADAPIVRRGKRRGRPVAKTHRTNNRHSYGGSPRRSSGPREWYSAAFDSSHSAKVAERMGAGIGVTTRPQCDESCPYAGVRAHRLRSDEPLGVTGRLVRERAAPTGAAPGQEPRTEIFWRRFGTAAGRQRRLAYRVAIR